MTVTWVAEYGNTFFLLIGGFSGTFIFLLQTQSAYCSSSGPVGRVLLLSLFSWSWAEQFGRSAVGGIGNDGNGFLEPRDQALSLVRGRRNVGSCVQIGDSDAIELMSEFSAAARRGRESLFLTGNCTSETEVALCCRAIIKCMCEWGRVRARVRTARCPSGTCGWTWAGWRQVGWEGSARCCLCLGVGTSHSW